jgi:hypothetical protein
MNEDASGTNGVPPPAKGRGQVRSKGSVCWGGTAAQKGQHVAAD